MFLTKIILKDDVPIYLKFPTLKDIVALDQMYDSLSEQTKFFFHPPLFEGKDLHRLIEKVKLVLSCSLTARKILLKIFPRAVIIPIVAVNKKGKVVGLTYIKIVNWLPRLTYSAVDGTVVTEKYQGKGLGYQMLLVRNKIARAYNIVEIWTYILTLNTKMLHLVNKLGYKVVAKTKHKHKKGGSMHTNVRCR